MTKLETYLKPVLSKHRGVALGVWGEAGIGKSYHANNLLKKLPCQSLALHSTASFTTLATQIPKPKKLALWASKTLERQIKGETQEAQTLIDALGATLAGLAPFVLHLEDIHETSTERLEFIQTLAQTAKRIKGAGLITTSRTEPPNSFSSIRLSTLSREDSDALLLQELKAPLPKEALEFIYARSAGNPLYTLEHLRYLVRQGYLWSDGKQWNWRVPDKAFMPVTVEALIEDQILRAKANDLNRYVLEAKAMLPLDASKELWQSVARVTKDELKKAIPELTRQGLFKDDSFAHPLFREVTYKTINKERKQNLARRAITVLQNEPEQAVAFIDEANLEKEKALALLTGAAEKATEHSELQAAKLLAKAVNFAMGEERYDLSLKAAEQLQNHDMVTATHLAEQVFKVRPNDIKVIAILARLYALERRDKDALDMLENIPIEKRNSQEALELIISVHNPLQNYKTLIGIFTEHSTQIKFSPPCIAMIIGVMSELSMFEEAEQLAKQTLEGLELSSWSYVSILHALAFQYNASNQYKKAEPLFRKAIKLIETHHNGRRLQIPLYNRALSLTWLVRFKEAKPEAERSRQISQEAGDVLQYCSATSVLGQLEYELGNYEKTETLLLESAEILSRYPAMPYSVDVHSNLTALYLDWIALPRNSVLALKHAHHSLELARQVEHYLVDGLHNVAVTESAFGNPQYALECAEEAQKVSLQIQTHLTDYYVDVAKATALEALERKDEAKSYFEKAAKLAREHKLGLFEQKSALELDHLNNDLESARKRMQWFEERGLMNGVNIAKRYFPELAEISQEPVLEASLRIEVLGSVQLVSSGKSESIRGSKRQQFLAMLLESKLSGRSEVASLDLIDDLYPDEDELKAANNLRGLVSTLRQHLGDNAILTTTAGYTLGNIQSDAETFLQTGDTGLWRGAYLEGLNLDTGTFTDSLYMSLYEKAKASLESDPKESARVGKILLEYDPYNQDYLKLCLQALRVTNNHKSLSRLYAEASERFLELGETLPENWKTFLAS